MILSINQPAYMPWIGYYDRIDASDLHIVLDHVQFEKNSFVNRNKIRTPKGWMWLTVPVQTKGKFTKLPINELRIVAGPWRRKHRTSLYTNYARAPYFNNHISFIDTFFDESNGTNCFLDLTQEFSGYMLDVLGINTQIMRSVQMNPIHTKSELVLELCLKVGAETYISGPFGRNYLDRRRFEEAGIKILFHDYKCVPYKQAWPGFESGLAAFDVLANNTAVASADIMRSGRQLTYV